MAGWWQTLKRWMRPPRTLKVTRAGRTYLVVTIGVGLGALNTGNNLLYLVLGFMLATIVLSGVLSERVIRDLRVKRLLPDGAFAKEPFALRYEVSRQKGQGFALKLGEAGGTLEGFAWVPHVRAGKSLVVRADAVAPRRGPLELKEVVVTTAFPLGIFEKSRRLEVEDVLLVYPRRGFACQPPDSLSGRPVADGGPSRFRDGTGDVMGLRDLTQGEDARRVHWKKSATVGRLLTVERQRDDAKQYVFTLPTSAAGEALEQACEETAALAHQLLAEGSEVGLLAGTRRIRPASGPGQERRLLTALAWAGFDETPAGGAA